MTHDTPSRKGGADDRSPFAAEAQWAKIVTSRLLLAPQPANLDALVNEARDYLPLLVRRIVVDIRTEVPDYAGTGRDRRQEVIALAVTAAAHQFLDSIRGAHPIDPKVVKLFRDMGHGEAVDGHTLEPMRRALQIATRHSWSMLHRFAGKHGLDVNYLGALGDALFAYLHHLDQEVARGHQIGTTIKNKARRELDQADMREHLINALLRDVPDSPARHAELAIDGASADWQLPPLVVVMRISFHREFPEVPALATSLSRTDHSPALVITQEDGAERLVETLLRSAPGLRIAVSGPVAPAKVAQADRWTRRALELVGQGAIPPKPLIRCDEHPLQLWLHAEPELRSRLVQDLLQPLLSETPNSREILSETMLAWLESRDSAPAIAAKLGVHPQTVRYRWKRINELFGTQLLDSEFVVTVTMVLKATVPLWKAGDTSDVEIFRARTESK